MTRLILFMFLQDKKISVLTDKVKLLQKSHGKIEGGNTYTVKNSNCTEIKFVTT